jgi:multidrug efflux pump subunit AcrA (membrane-fusion protein)
LAIAVDGMGGDHAPGPILEGCLDAIDQLALKVLFLAEEAPLRAAIQRGGLQERVNQAIALGALELLPTGADLIAEAKISPADIAFIQVGQRASVKLDAYDSAIFGALRGNVSYISPDVLNEDTKQGPHSYYRVHVLITESEFKGKKARDIQLRPGLSASVEIKAMERTVLSYLTKPITKTLSQSMGER